MTCKDCLHYKMCLELHYCLQMGMSGPEFCFHFTDRSEWVHLPCRAGQQLWFEENGKVKCSTVDRLIYEELSTDDIFTRIEGYGFSVFFEDVGKIVFLTREEAEKALRERDE